MPNPGAPPAIQPPPVVAPTPPDAPPGPSAPAQANTPAPAQPLLRIERSATGTRLTIHGGPEGTKSYQILAADAVTGPWTPVDQVAADPSGTTIWSDPQATSPRFYKVEALATPITQTFLLPDSGKVLADLSKKTGDLLAADGTVVGPYYALKVVDDQGAPWHLVLLVKSGTGGYYYLVEDRRGEPIHLGSAPQVMAFLDIQGNSVIDEAPVKVLIRFLKNPLAPYSYEERRRVFGFMQRSLSASMSTNDEYIPLILNRYLTALAGSPDFDFTADNTQLTGLGENLPAGIVYDSVRPDHKQQIAERLEQVWNTLSLSAKATFLAGLSTESTAAASTLGGLLVRYLGDLAKAYPDPSDFWRGFWLSRILVAEYPLLRSLELDRPLRTRMIHETLGALQPVPNVPFAMQKLRYLYKILTRGDGITVDSATYRLEASAIVRQVVSERNEDPGLVAFAMRYLSAFVDADTLQRVEQQVSTWMAQYDGSAPSARRLLSALDWPIAPEVKRRIEERVVMQDLNGWDFRVLFGSDNAVVVQSLQGLSPQGRTILLGKIVALAVSQVQRLDEWTLVRFIHCVKESPSFELDAALLFPLLTALNPQPGEEPDSQYQAHLARLQALWVRGIFLYNASGKSYPAFLLDVLDDYQKNHPGWITTAVIPAPGGGVNVDSGSNLMALDWTQYPSPSAFASTLLHEGAHALHVRLEPPNVLAQLVDYWFENSSNPRDYVPDYAYYSKTNRQEYFAEFCRVWFSDTKSWLTTALANYRDNRPAMLNMFLAIWNLSKPSDAPPGDVLPLFKLQDTGLLAREWIPGGWTRGDMKDGVFTFTLDGTTYTVTYQGYQITDLASAPAPVSPPPPTAPVQATAPAAGLPEGAAAPAAPSATPPPAPPVAPPAEAPPAGLSAPTVPPPPVEGQGPVERPPVSAPAPADSPALSSAVTAPPATPPIAPPAAPAAPAPSATPPPAAPAETAAGPTPAAPSVSESPVPAVPLPLPVPTATEPPILTPSSPPPSVPSQANSPAATAPAPPAAPPAVDSSEAPASPVVVVTEPSTVLPTPWSSALDASPAPMAAASTEPTPGPQEALTTPSVSLPPVTKPPAEPPTASSLPAPATVAPPSVIEPPPEATPGISVTPPEAPPLEPTLLTANIPDGVPAVAVETSPPVPNGLPTFVPQTVASSPPPLVSSVESSTTLPAPWPIEEGADTPKGSRGDAPASTPAADVLEPTPVPSPATPSPTAQVFVPPPPPPAPVLTPTLPNSAARPVDWPVPGADASPAPVVTTVVEAPPATETEPTPEAITPVVEPTIEAPAATPVVMAPETPISLVGSPAEAPPSVVSAPAVTPSPAGAQGPVEMPSSVAAPAPADSPALSGAGAPPALPSPAPSGPPSSAAPPPSLPRPATTEALTPVTPPTDVLKANPTASAAPAQPLLGIEQSPTGTRLTIHGGPDGTKSYRIYVADEVTGPWKPVDQVAVNPAGVTIWTDPQAASPRFYKVEALSTTLPASSTKGLHLTLEDPLYGVELLSAYAQDVLVDASKDQGDVVLANNQKVGRYAFYAVGEAKESSPYILKVTYWVSQKDDPSSNTAHLFMVNHDRTQFQVIGSSRFYQAPVEATKPFYQTLARFFDDPLALSQSDYALLISRSGQGDLLVDRAFIAEFLPRYLDRLVTALTQRPGYQFAGGTDPLNGINRLYDYSVSSGAKQVILRHVEQAWQQLSLSTKAMVLTHLQTGNAETATVLSNLLIQYLDEKASAASSPASRGIPDEMLPAIQNILMTFEVGLSVRDRLIKRTLAEFSAVLRLQDYEALSAANFIYEAVVKNDGITLDAGAYRQALSQLLGTILRNAGYSIDYPATRRILTSLSQYVTADAIQRVDAELKAELAAYQGSPFTARIFTAALGWPLSSDTKQAVETAIRNTDLSQWSLTELNMVLAEDGVLQMSPSGLEALFEKVASTLSSKLNAMELAASPLADAASAKRVLARSVDLMMQAGALPRDRHYFEDVVARLNPRQPNESETAYQARQQQILEILSNGVVISDTWINPYSDVPYLGGILEVIKNRPGWTNMVLLDPTNSAGVAIPGILAIGTTRPTPGGTRVPESVFTVLDTITHEITHALVERKRPATQFLEVVAYNAYHNYITRTRQDFDFGNVYGLTNTDEYTPEFDKYWFEDSKSYLTTALTNYRAGHPAMLNMFLAIWNLSKPSDAPAGDGLPLFKLQDTGLLAREWIPGGWTRGDMKDGVFTFTLDGTKYTVTYQGYKIVSVS